MPYFMRLTDSGIGMHVGPVFQTPQSHGMHPHDPLLLCAAFQDR